MTIGVITYHFVAYFGYKGNYESPAKRKANLRSPPSDNCTRGAHLEGRKCRRCCRSSTTLVMQTANALAMVTTAISKHH